MAPVAPPLYKLVTNCTAADGNGVGINNVSAFWDEDWWEMMWVGKTREDMIEVVSKRSPRNLLRDREIRRHQKVVDATTGEMVGYARWLVPSTHTSCWLDAQTPAVSTAEDQEYQAVFDNTPLNPRDDMDGTDDHIGEWRKKRDLTRPYLLLDYLAVHPDHQQRGIASSLVKSGIAQAKKDNLDIVLVAMGAKAVELYRKNGFGIIAEDHQSLKPWGRDAMYDTYEMRWTNPGGLETETIP